jgi:hypothetical protein
MLADIIKPIELLSGSHADTGTTGQGCFMNVIAYLNGEPQITDQSPCVCVTVRPIAIWLNDWLLDSERYELIPYIERAMGSATTDKSELSRRAWLAVAMASEMKQIASASAAAAKRAAAPASASAAAYAPAYASAAASADASARIKAAAFRFLDAALPKREQVSQEVVERANKLLELTA